MPINEHEIIDILQAQFNIERAETLAYLRLLDQLELPADEVAQALGTSRGEAVALLERMVSEGLIIRSTGSSDRFSPLHPRMTLTNIFKTYENGVVQGLRERRATVDRIVNLLTPIYEEKAKTRLRKSG